MINEDWARTARVFVSFRCPYSKEIGRESDVFLCILVLCDWLVTIPFLTAVHFSVSKKIGSSNGGAAGILETLGCQAQRLPVLARALPAEREPDPLLVI